MTSVNCGYGRSDCARLMFGDTRMPLFTTPKNGLGTVWLSAVPSARYFGSSWLRLSPPSTFVCRSCPAVPTYEASTAVRHGNSRWSVTFHCRVHGVGLLSRSGAWIWPPTAVSKPWLDPGDEVKPAGYGSRSSRNGVMPSIDDTHRFSVRNPNGPTVPFACWYDGP